MSSLKLQPNRVSFSAAISACEKSWQWQRALSLLLGTESERFSAWCLRFAFIQPQNCKESRKPSKQASRQTKKQTKTPRFGQPKSKSHIWRLSRFECQPVCPLASRFEEMCEMTLQPNAISFSGAISACEPWMNLWARRVQGEAVGIVVIVSATGKLHFEVTFPVSLV